jgi:hypothetical protein
MKVVLLGTGKLRRADVAVDGVMVAFVLSRSLFQGCLLPSKGFGSASPGTRPSEGNNLGQIVPKG